MSITLSALGRPGPGDVAPAIQISGNVVHFGSSPPEGKHAIRLRGEDIAPHHAKMFFSQDQFWLVNLSGLPCAVLKASGRTVFLTVTEPVCELEVGELFRIGPHMFQVQELSPPMWAAPEPAARRDEATAPLLESLRVPLEPQPDAHPEDPHVWHSVLEFASSLLRYQQHDEMWRQAADTVARCFHRRWQHLDPLAVVGAATWDRAPGPDGLRAAAPGQAVSLEPSHDREAGTPIAWHAILGTPGNLLGELHDLASRGASAFLCPWRRENPSVSVTCLTLPVSRGEQATGALSVLVRWPRDAAFCPAPDDLYLLSQLSRSLGLALTFLEQRLRALEFLRVHDIGNAVAESMHDQAHLIDLVDRPLEHLSDAVESAGGAVAGGSRLEIAKVRTVARQVRGVARATMEFARSAATDAAAEASGFEDCRAALQEYSRVLKWLVYDRFVDANVTILAGEEPFLASLDGVMAALRNLLLNTRKGLQERGDVPGRACVRLTARTGSVPAGSAALDYNVLGLLDNGAGIPPRIAPRLFRERIADSRSGHGLGSRIVRRVMDQHRGLIRFATALGAGTVVELWFPRLRPVAPAGLLAEQWPPFENHRRKAGEVGDVGEEYVRALLDAGVEAEGEAQVRD